jgi:DNA-binding LacI/PurR family transcriptional regulator
VQKRFSIAARRQAQAVQHRDRRLCSEESSSRCDDAEMRAPPNRATVREVARAAGVSTATVSHALNGTGRVAAATRTRVIAAAAQLGYRADSRGRALQSGRTMSIALLLPPTSDSHRSGEFVDAHFYLELAGAAAQAALARDHALLLLPSPSEPSDLQRFAFDGALLSDPEVDDRRLAMFDTLGIPVVTLERDAGRPERSWWVASDNVPNTLGLLDHLAAAGSSSIALFTIDAAWSWFKDIEAAYRDWTARTGRPTIVEAVPRGTEHSDLVAAAARLLERFRPDAILTPPEQLACVVLDAAQQAGLRVPEDLRVAAAVDGADARASGITALDLMPRAQAEAGVELLLERLSGGAPAERLVGAQLRARASTGRRPLG